MKICFATNNKHKLEEVCAMVPPGFEIQSLAEIGCSHDLPETQQTIEGNAIQKARFVAQQFGIDCFADDTGLEVDALNGQPGVDTAHYAGPERSAEKNMALLLANLHGKPNRKARFKTVIALVWQGELYSFEGKIEGTISTQPQGNEGFGYDPVFIPDGFRETFAELGAEVKNRLSHRAMATKQLVDFLSALQTK